MRASAVTIGLLAVVGGVLMLEACTAIGAAAQWRRDQGSDGSSMMKDGRFVNPQPPRDDMAEAMRKWLRGAPNREPEAEIRTKRPDLATSSLDHGELRVTWLGHSTVLVEIEGRRVLTDPVWRPRASPSRIFGPRRFFEPVISLADLPDIDTVVISHDHYDHLDHEAAIEMARRGARLVVPIGVGSRLRSWGVSEDRIVELDWWQEIDDGPLRLVCTPARHFSGRGLLDRNRTLWSGWAMIGEHHRVFFSGDSGFSKDFAEIGRRLGPFDLTMMDSGAYDSTWADLHMGPEQAVSAHAAVRGAVLLPIHWGTFNLALHGWTEPAERVLAEARERGARVVIPRPGESFDPLRPPEVEPWWPSIPWSTASEAPIVSSD